MTDFSIQPREVEGAVVCEIRGYWDEMANEPFDQAIADLLQAGKTRIILDLTNCTDFNSQGASGLIDLAVRVREVYSGRLILFGMSITLDKVFEMLGVYSLAEREETLEKALELLRTS